MKDILSEVNWLAVTIAFPIGFIGTIVMRKVANHFEWLVHPGPGRIHRRAVPQIGGIAIMVGFIVAAWPKTHSAWQRWLLLVFGGVALAQVVLGVTTLLLHVPVVLGAAH